MRESCTASLNFLHTNLNCCMSAWRWMTSFTISSRSSHAWYGSVLRQDNTSTHSSNDKLPQSCTPTTLMAVDRRLKSFQVPCDATCDQRMVCANRAFCDPITGFPEVDHPYGFALHKQLVSEHNRVVNDWDLECRLKSWRRLSLVMLGLQLQEVKLLTSQMNSGTFCRLDCT